MAAPVWEGVGATFASVAAVVAPLPAGVAENDILLLFVESADPAGAAPTGYAHVTTVSPQEAGGGGLATRTVLAIYWKRATASESEPTVADTGNHQFGFIARISGCITTGDPWDVANGDADTTADTAVDILGATTTVVDTLVVLAATTATDTLVADFAGTPIYTNANLASITTRFNEATDVGNGGAIGVATGVKATAEDYGTSTGTANTSSKQGRISIALKPPAEGATPIAASDALSVSVTETQESLLASTVADSPTVALTESQDSLLQSTVTDNPTVGLTEAQSSLLLSEVVDSLGLSVQEAALVAVLLAVSETLNVSVVEAAALLISEAKAVSDTLTVGAADTVAALEVFLSVVETLTVGLTEQQQSLLSTAVSDLISVALIETQDSLLFSSVSDTATLTLTESSAVKAILAVADSLSISVVEAAVLVFLGAVFDPFIITAVYARAAATSEFGRTVITGSFSA